MLSTILWIIGVILIIVGIVRIVQKDFLWGAILLVVGLLIGPGGGLLSAG
ncbi:GPGG-motif small membrane protein [Demequina sp. SO4-13]